MSDEFELIDVETCTRAGTASEGDRDVDFPSFVDGWTDILDCRHSPYTDQSLEEICEFADHVRKPFLLVPAGRYGDESDEATS